MKTSVPSYIGYGLELLNLSFKSLSLESKPAINHFIMFDCFGNVQTLVGSFLFFVYLWFAPKRINFQQMADNADHGLLDLVSCCPVNITAYV